VTKGELVVNIKDILDAVSEGDIDEVELDEIDGAVELSDELSNVRTFEEAGILCDAPGLVIDTEDGEQFQIQIVQSR